MNLKTMASTLLLSTFLVGGMATQAEAVTLPEPTTHTVTQTYYTDYNMSDDWRNPVYPQVTVTATFDGYYGEFQFDNSEFKTYYGMEYVLDENGIRTDEVLEYSNIYVIAEGSTVKYTISCPEAPEITAHPYLDGLADNHYQTECIHMEWSAGFGVMESRLGDSKALTVNNQERYVYSYYKTDDGQYGFSPTLGLTRLVFPTGDIDNLYTSDDGTVSWWSSHIVNLDKVLTINQEKIETLEQEGEICIETFGEFLNFDSMDANDKEHWGNVVEGFVDTHTMKYNGLLELFGGTTPETTPEDSSTPEAETPSETPSSPIYDPWAESFVEYAVENGLIVDSLGMDYTKNITRLQIADLLVNMVEQYTGETLEAREEVFPDSSNTQVLKAAQAGLITGREDGSFDPDNVASRQEMAIMVYNAIKVMEEMTGAELVDHSATTISGYSDLDTAWAKEALSVLANAGIITGDGNGTISPNATTNIQVALVMNNNLFQLGK